MTLSQRQNPASLPPSIDGSPAPASVDPATIPGPQTANLGDGANGQLNERAVVDALLACLPMHEDGTGHVADCGYDWDATTRCGCYTLPDRLAAILREHAERAWDEAVRECHDLGWMHDFARSDALDRNPYRAARQEQDRG